MSDTATNDILYRRNFNTIDITKHVSSMRLLKLTKLAVVTVWVLIVNK